MRAAASVANDFVIDYEHQGLSDVEAPAAGWIKKLVNRGSGGIWAVVEWTPRAALYLKNREYRYLSPVFLRRLSDKRVVRFLHAALTNTPAIDGMVPVVNRKGDFIPPAYPPNGKDVETKQKEVRSMKRLMAALGLTETATEDDATAAVAALKADAEAIVANRAVFEALELDPSAPESEVTGLITALKASHSRVEEATRRAGDLESQLAERDAEDAVAFAMNVGKITPAERQWALDYAKRDPEGFKTYVNKTPVKVHRGELARDGAFSRSVAHDEVQVSVNRMLGVSDEMHRKHHAVGK
jgi:phage I-like protein